MKIEKRIKIALLLIAILAVATLLYLLLVLKQNVFWNLLFVLACFVVIALSFYYLELTFKHNNTAIASEVNKSVTMALKEGNVGILVYNEDYQITWLSGMMLAHGFERTGEKLLTWLPELQNLIGGLSEREVVIINEEKFQVTKPDEAYVLFFKDITKEYDLEKRLKNDAYVLGFANFDNYDESSENDDSVSYVNANIKLPVIDYFKKYGVVYRTLRNNRLQLVLNGRIFNEIRADRFSILNKVRTEAKKNEMDITLSLAFAMGSENITELDELAFSLLELAQTRGGDQIVIQEVGKETIYYGGSSEAKEKQSKVRVRVIANTLRQLINKSSNVIIVGHRDADADCVGAAIALSAICRGLKKDASIVIYSGGIEAMISDVLRRYQKTLNDRHDFINENEALNMLESDTLVIMVDHNSLDQSNSALLLKQAKHIAIIDHHRRKADLDVDASLLYLEAGSSSSTELVGEFLAYLPRQISLTSEEANIMYLGLIIDTNNFRSRTGARTFDVARVLRQAGADPVLCDEFAQEPFDKVVMRNRLISGAEKYSAHVILSCVEEGTYPRSIASQAADSLLRMREIDAAFVICNSDSGDVLLSARSNGRINVQAISEKMNGGGHLSAAGLQRKNGSVRELKEELIGVLNNFFIDKEQSEDESNIA